MSTVEHVLPRLRRICLALPETWEGASLGHPTFYAGKKSFAVLEPMQGCVTFKATPGAQQELVRDTRFFVAPYSGQHGWVGMPLTGKVDWTHVSMLLQDSYRLIALKRMLHALDGRAPRRGP